MNIDITKLRSGMVNSVPILGECEFTEEQIKSVDLLDLKDVTLRGNIWKDTLDEFILELDVTGTMVLPCAITLKPVFQPFHTIISGNLLDLLEEIGTFDKKIENTIDILPIIWENILMEIPMRVVSPDAQDIDLKGDGWKLVKEDEEKKPEINPELSKLQQLLDEKEV